MQHNDISPIPIGNGDELINVNCWEYLCNLQGALGELLESKRKKNYPKIFKIFQDVKDNCDPTQQYKKDFAYGNLYTRFLLALEDLLELEMINKRELTDFKKLLDAIYANPNKALERSLGVIQPYLKETSHTSPKFSKKISKSLTPPRARKINVVTPVEVSSKWSAIRKYVAYELKPQSTTSLACVRTYKHQKFADSTGSAVPTEYRFGTQGQYHNFFSRISPLFKVWAQVNEPQDKSKITHVYINNLPVYASFFKFKLETRLTHRLHQFEKQNPHVAVITLPAFHGLLSKDVLKNNRTLKPAELQKNIAQILLTFTDKKAGERHDVKMSENVRKKLYENDDAKDLVEKLLNESFNALGVKRESATEVELQAVYFHFVKFKFTDYALTKLNPTSFNMTCFDAIDRGGVSSAYYNLMKSIEKNHPMDEEEFNRALHAAPTMVKGRGMNHQIKVLWNTIDVYLKARPFLTTDLDWLKNWRNRNAPEESPNYFLYRFEALLPSSPSQQQGFFSPNPEEVRTIKKIISVIKGETTLEVTDIKMLGKIREQLKNTDKEANKLLTDWMKRQTHTRLKEDIKNKPAPSKA